MKVTIGTSKPPSRSEHDSGEPLADCQGLTQTTSRQSPSLLDVPMDVLGRCDFEVEDVLCLAETNTFFLPLVQRKAVSLRRLAFEVSAVPQQQQQCQLKQLFAQSRPAWPAPPPGFFLGQALGAFAAAQLVAQASWVWAGWSFQQRDDFRHSVDVWLQQTAQHPTDERSPCLQAYSGLRVLGQHDDHGRILSLVRKLQGNDVMLWALHQGLCLRHTQDERAGWQLALEERHPAVKDAPSIGRNRFSSQSSDPSICCQCGGRLFVEEAMRACPRTARTGFVAAALLQADQTFEAAGPIAETTLIHRLSAQEHKARQAIRHTNDEFSVKKSYDWFPMLNGLRVLQCPQRSMHARLYLTARACSDQLTAIAQMAPELSRTDAMDSLLTLCIEKAAQLPLGPDENDSDRRLSTWLFDRLVTLLGSAGIRLLGWE